MVDEPILPSVPVLTSNPFPKQVEVLPPKQEPLPQPIQFDYLEAPPPESPVEIVTGPDDESLYPLPEYPGFPEYPPAPPVSIIEEPPEFIPPPEFVKEESNEGPIIHEPQEEPEPMPKQPDQSPPPESMMWPGPDTGG